MGKTEAPVADTVAQLRTMRRTEYREMTRGLAAHIWALLQQELADWDFDRTEPKPSLGQQIKALLPPDRPSTALDPSAKLPPILRGNYLGFIKSLASWQLHAAHHVEIRNLPAPAQPATEGAATISEHIIVTCCLPSEVLAFLEEKMTPKEQRLLALVRTYSEATAAREAIKLHTSTLRAMGLSARSSLFRQ